MRKALVIGSNRIEDLGDLLAIARAEGKKALRVEKVRVLPWLEYDDELNYIVLVEAHNSPGAGGHEEKGVTAKNGTQAQIEKTSSHYIHCPFLREVVPVEKCRECRRKHLCPQMGGAW